MPAVLVLLVRASIPIPGGRSLRQWKIARSFVKGAPVQIKTSPYFSLGNEKKKGTRSEKRIKHREGEWIGRKGDGKRGRWRGKEGKEPEGGLAPDCDSRFRGIEATVHYVCSGKSTNALQTVLACGWFRLSSPSLVCTTHWPLRSFIDDT